MLLETLLFVAPAALQLQIRRAVPHSVAAALHTPRLAPVFACSTREEQIGALGVPDSVGKPLVLLLATQAILFVGVGACLPALPLYGAALGLPASATGVVISTPAVALLLLSRASGGVVDNVGRKPAMLVGMAAIAISDAGTALATGLPTLLVARLGLGAGRSLSESGERAFLSDLAQRAPELRGRALAAQQAVAAAGIAVGAPIGGAVVEEYGAPAAFLCVTAAALAALVGYSFLPETLEPGAADDAEAADDDAAEPDADAWLELIAEPRWRALAAAEAASKIGTACKIASIPVIAASLGGPTAAGGLLSAAGVAGLAGAPVGGYATDRFGARATAAVSGTLSGAALLAVPAALTAPPEGVEPAAAFGGLVLAWAAGVAAQAPALTALAQRAAPPGKTATALNLPRAVGDAAFIVAPAALGALTDSAGAGAAPAAAGACALLGVAALAAWVEPESR